MGKELPPESPESTPSIAPASGRREKVSGINVRPDFLQSDLLDEGKKIEIVSEVIHNINNPLSVYLAGLEFIESKTNIPEQHLKNVYTFYEKIRARIEHIMKRLKSLDERPISFEEIARSLASMQIDILSLKTATNACLVYVDTFDAEVFEVFEELVLSQLRLRQRTRDAIARVESANPQKEFPTTIQDASMATTAALQRVGWKRPVRAAYEQAADITIAVEPLSVVFENIIINARRYGGQLDILAEVQDRHFVLRFEDDGPGFSGDPSKLFEIFVQGKSGSKSGFGVGMSACKRIMDRLRGEISAENMFDEEGNVCGARITLRFPIVDDFSG